MSSGERETEQIRIPQIPASTITEKVRNGDYSLRLSRQNYDKHVRGTFDYERYRRSREEKGYGPQSFLAVTREEAQDIINRLSGTGIIKVRRNGTPMDLEWVSCDRVIGRYWDKGQFFETNKAAIYHGKKGSHLVPVKGNNYD